MAFNFATLAPQQAPAAEPEDESALKRLLRTMKGGVLGGAAIVGNTLNKPSRALWGSANYLAGGESGGGLLNLIPFSDTMGLTDPDKGVEASEFLADRGVISHNDPTKWEWSDLGRGLIDIAGDPVSYVAPLPLTKLGKAAAKSGSLQKGLLRQIGAGERGLVGGQIPLWDANARGAAFTGPAVEAGLRSAGSKVMKTPYVGKGLQAVGTHVVDPAYRYGRAMFDSKVEGATSHAGQAISENRFKLARDAEYDTDSTVQLWGQMLESVGRNTPMDHEIQRHFVETGRWLRPPDPTEELVMREARRFMDSNLSAADQSGRKAWQHADPAGIGYMSRHRSAVDKPLDMSGPGAGPLRQKDPGAKSRKMVLQGFTEGTLGVNRLFRDEKIVDLVRAIKAGTPHPLVPAPFDLTTKAGREGAKKLIGTEIEKAYGPEILKDIAVLTKKGTPQMLNGAPVVLNRYEELANLMLGKKAGQDYLGKGIYNNSWLADVHATARKQKTVDATGRALIQGFAEHAVDAGMVPNGVALGKLLRSTASSSGLSSKKVLQRVYETRTGTSLAGLKPKALAAVLRQEAAREVSADLAKDIVRKWAKHESPEYLKDVGKAFDAASSLWKAGVLTHPARHARDFTSSGVRRWEEGWLGLGGGANRATDQTLRGQATQGLETIPAVQDFLRQHHLPATPENADMAYRAMYAARYRQGEMFSPEGTVPHNVTPQTGVLEPRPGRTYLNEGQYRDASPIMDPVPGMKPETPAEFVKATGKLFVGRDPKTGKFSREALKPWAVRGFGGRAKSTFGPVAASDKIGQYADSYHRMASDLELLKRGYDPATAADEVQAAFSNYSPHSLTAFEQQIRRAVPFYSFTKGQALKTGKNFLMRPGGRQMQMIGAIGEANESDPFVPEYVASTTSIPLGERENGNKAFITGLGLMHEAPLGFLGGGAYGALAEGLSQTNPMIKAPIELASGESFFQRGPMGGRDLGDMDPLLGRTLSNIGQSLGLRDKNERDPIRFPGQQPIEYALANSPISRLLSTARTIADPRKDAGSKAINTLLGARVTDISPAAQDAVLRDLAHEFGKGLGAREFTNIRFNQEQLAEMSPEEAEMAKAFNELQNQLIRRRKARAAEASAAK